MTRKRWLPENVTEWTDRHGKRRYRFRKTGLPTHHFKAAPGTAEFMAEYRAASIAAPPPPTVKVDPGTLDALCESFCRTPGWERQKETTKRTYRGVIERFRESRTKRGERRGALPLASLTTEQLDRILATMADRPGAANLLRKTLKRVFRHGMKVRMVTSNPAELTDRYKTGHGFHTWTDDEIEAYRSHWPYGTSARLTLELALNTAARRCNVAALERSMLKLGKFHIAHAKGCDPVIVRASPESLRAIEAMGVTGIGHFVVTSFGKPFSVAGLGNKFREWCDEAGLKHCTMHGLRKAQSRRLAESGATSLEGRAVTGHKKDETFAYYAEKADRERLADTALANLEIRFAKPSKESE